MTTPTIPPTVPDIPLTTALRIAYESLEDELEMSIEGSSDPGVLEALNSALTNVDDVLTKDDMYRLEANTNLYAALLQQVNATNDELKVLQTQIRAIASGVETFGGILSAIAKVVTLLPAA